ncbi:hypothetical protein H4R33_001264 [Dimargaris cristalligena]|uniref:Uncharacterized protein n=1 Tax=Dimargaris cristalligena TaxID=215637 RepID=A0A4P9ZVJ3_9FUNG|nr:hypothetical protein H4R33_001264 [Dimargaris cristalligena]RKP36650.1 hypothetical protein BJ085DRAFT_28879 [Dimargaris cristalligena]|eukprot:RKP36650.1 hypothetical protein BJ085DRAFT_28879 [Dimargaris cristalligena]
MKLAYTAIILALTALTATAWTAAPVTGRSSVSPHITGAAEDVDVDIADNNNDDGSPFVAVAESSRICRRCSPAHFWDGRCHTCERDFFWDRRCHNCPRRHFRNGRCQRCPRRHFWDRRCHGCKRDNFWNGSCRGCRRVGLTEDNSED